MWRWIRRLLAAVVVLAVVAIAAGWWLMRGSLPRLDGTLALPGLSAPVTVQRDAIGVVTIDAANADDAMRALGYVHAQERYFEMDLLRRTAAGELAELFGAVAIDTDQRHRVHRMRARATAHLDDFAGAQRPQLQAYVDGVNAGVANLRVRPWPYLLLRQSPTAWTPTDSALTGYAMYFDLQGVDHARELSQWRIAQASPPALAALLLHDGSRWDAPLQGAPRGDAVLPDAQTLDLGRLPAPGVDAKPLDPDQARADIGSNNFAVAGTLTADGRAIVADDMHLGLRAPNIWFRARLRYADPQAPGGRVDVSGFTLPGLPGIVVGSNTHVAWGFTNSSGDWSDWQQQPACADGAGCKAPVEHVETIRVAGAAPVAMTVRETEWGPILRTGDDGSTLALRWAAHLRGSLRLGLLELARARDLDDALAKADAIALPAQNLLIGDRSGRIAWRLLGTVPARAAACDRKVNDGAVVASCPPWPLQAHDVQIVDPADGRLWTANARVVDGEMLAQIGDGGYALGARSLQIRDALYAKPRFDERALLAIQLDDRALLLAPWWQLLRERAAAVRKRDGALAELATAATRWEGRASTQSVSYRIVRAWRLAVHRRIVEGLTAPAQVALGTDFAMPELTQIEGVAWPLVTQRPPHLLPKRYRCEPNPQARASACGELVGWDGLFEDAAREVRDELAKTGPLAQRSWGERNTARICHPLSAALPKPLKPSLCMPADPLPGDSGMPRVQGPDFGASERMVVSPGHEADGIVHMPGGQSGHPLSPFWGAGHDDWVHGRPTPFLPGKAAHTLKLAPP